MALSIGAVMGGPERVPCFETFRLVMREFSGSEAKPFVNVVFHFPGSLHKPDFTGLRTGRFSSKEQGFMVQVAVPESVAQSEDFAVVVPFFCSSSAAALQMALPRWQKHNIEFPLAADLRLIENCEKGLLANA